MASMASVSRAQQTPDLSLTSPAVGVDGGIYQTRKRTFDQVTTAPEAAPPVLMGPNGRYEVRELLGEGTFAKVRKAFDTAARRDVAVKTSKPDVRDSSYHLENEQRILMDIGDDDHFPKVLDSFEPEPGQMAIVEEVLPKDMLDSCLAKEKLEWSDLLSTAYQGGQALQTLKRRKIVHTDIKPDNLVRHNGALKLIDFGSARTIDQLKQGTFVQPRDSRAPEVILKLPEIGHPIDVWSFGIALFELAAKTPLYESELADGEKGADADLMKAIAKILRLPPKNMIERSEVAQEIFTLIGDGSEEYRFMGKRPFVNGISEPLPVYIEKRIRKIYPKAPESEVRNFADLIVKMVAWERITPEEVEKHPLFSNYQYLVIECDPKWKRGDECLLYVWSDADFDDDDTPRLEVDLSKNERTHHFWPRVKNNRYLIRMYDENGEDLIDTVVEIPLGARLLVSEEGITVIKPHKEDGKS